MFATPADAICPAARMLGWHDVGTTVTLVAADGSFIRRREGTYLDAHDLDGPVVLGDGVEMMFHDLQIRLPRGESLYALIDAVTDGLAESTWTAVEVPGGEGVLVITLTPWQEMPGAPIPDELDLD
ncbi:hypothetical protein GOHSU_16_00920 [Gordonia hirsuta DSM 44140 = NBRC 16056]|uniref:Uncharacterized protein n=1 Tax=Gordonia hirsuta DSM 44140 = NBRC 16056 TaxID=1121927 RepID=L7L892_9ACTN|nr:hypothetical protein [Gordonia hirsuta]GAC57134.1 hypothetical protein GOHSU_16_00920 [Gordonia hirsuta DSM 44140 = NBRC 16056]